MNWEQCLKMSHLAIELVFVIMYLYSFWPNTWDINQCHYNKFSKKVSIRKNIYSFWFFDLWGVSLPFISFEKQSKKKDEDEIVA